MNPKQITSMGWRMAEVYGEVTDRILVNMARHFKFIAEGEEPSGAWDYQVRKLAELGQVTRETEDIILQSLDGADDHLRYILEKAIFDSLEGVDKTLKEAAENGLLRESAIPNLAPNQMQAFQAYYRQSADKLNLVNTVMLESTQNAYQATVADIANRMVITQSTMNVAAGEVISGVSSMNQAIRDGVQKMVKTGITGFVDRGGHRWSPEAYVEMDVRTTLANTARAAVLERNEEYGNDLYQVSWHDGARPLCYPWQGKVISEQNISRDVEDDQGNTVHVYAQSETTYGQPAGLFGINCGHYPIPFIPGFSRIRPPKQDEEENNKEYEESQKQRALERKLREEKRDLAVLKAQGASDEEIKAQRQKVKDASNNLNEFSKETGRARRSGREGRITDAKWKTDNGEVRRFNGRYVSTDQQLHVSMPKPKQNPTPSAPATPAVPAPVLTETMVTETLPKSGIQPLELTKWSKTPTEQQIIDSLGGGDQTKGSCSSLAFAYAGNEAGFEVRDFRGGESCNFFSRTGNINKIAGFNGVDGITVQDTNDIKASHALFKSIEEGKKYYFHTGRHAAVVRKTGEKLEYLELQSRLNNGWHELNDRVLRYRFAAKRSHTTYEMKYQVSSGLMDIAKLAKSPDFIEMLKYINTAVDQQKKGIGGGIK